MFMQLFLHSLFFPIREKSGFICNEAELVPFHCECIVECLGQSIAKGEMYYPLKKNVLPM